MLKGILIGVLFVYGLYFWDQENRGEEPYGKMLAIVTWIVCLLLLTGIIGS